MREITLTRTVRKINWEDVFRRGGIILLGILGFFIKDFIFVFGTMMCFVLLAMYSFDKKEITEEVEEEVTLEVVGGKR